MVIGILALQGCIEPHVRHLKKLGAEVRLVRLATDFNGIRGLILPGGESTTMIRLAQSFGLWDSLKNQAEHIPYWGICAGSILMASEVENPSQDSLGVMDLKVRRNAYGRQLESFQQDLLLNSGKKEQAVFIRAPKFVSWGTNTKVLASLKDEAVFLEEGKHMVSAFHPELTDSSWCHEFFLAKIST